VLTVIPCNVQISEHIERLVTLLKGEEPANPDESDELDEGADPVEGLHLTANTSASTMADGNDNESDDDEDHKIEEV
jgi:hypothetical protein